MEGKIVDFLLGEHRRLSTIVRYNSVLKLKEENVAEHSYYVCLYSMILCRYLWEMHADFEFETVMQSAIMHDMEEVISGDIITPIKDYLSSEYDKVCDLSINEILKTLPKQLQEDLKRYCFWIKDKDIEDTLEVRIVKAADCISGLVYSWEQINLGNRNFYPILHRYEDKLSKVCKGSELQQLTEILISRIEGDLK